MRMKKNCVLKREIIKSQGLFDVINQCVYYPLEKCDWITDLLSHFFFPPSSRKTIESSPGEKEVWGTTTLLRQKGKLVGFGFEAKVASFFDEMM